MKPDEIAAMKDRIEESIAKTVPQAENKPPDDDKFNDNLKMFVPQAGFEPATTGLGNQCSIP